MASQKRYKKTAQQRDGRTKLIKAPHRTVLTDYGKGHIYKHSKKVQENDTKRGCNRHTEMIQAETQRSHKMQ